MYSAGGWDTLSCMRSTLVLEMTAKEALVLVFRLHLAEACSYAEEAEAVLPSVEEVS